MWPRVLVAAEWRITPRIQARETYTDNVRLAPRGREESDMVTEVDPGVSITGRSARLQFNADYTFRYRIYAKNSDANGHANALNSNGLLDVWDRKLFLDASARIAEQDISPLGATPSSDVNITDNRTEVRQWRLSPYWVSRLGTFANFQARYTWQQAKSKGETTPLDSESNGVNVGISSGSRFTDFGWALTYDKQEIESTRSEFPQRELESLTASASYRFLPTVSALGSVGRDDNTYGSVSGDTGGNFYSVGLEWAPSRRTKFRGEVGERYFGDTASVYAEHRTRLTTWTLSYVEQIVADPGLLTIPVGIDTAGTLDRIFQSTVPDPLERQLVVQNFMAQNGLPAVLPGAVNFLTDEVSLSERLRAAFGYRGVRSTLLLTAFRDKRRRESNNNSGSPVATDPFLLSRHVDQVGASAILSWRFSERTVGSASLTHTRSDLVDIDQEEKDTRFTLGVVHQFQPDVRGSLFYRRLDSSTNRSGADVRENAITGTLSLTF
jgi:uncharacterized protein (PEP-CTERM system associated)